MLAIAVIPCAALLAIGSVAVVSLGEEAHSAFQWSEDLSSQLDLVVDFVVEVENERTLSLAALTGDPQAVAGLPAQRAKTDAVLKRDIEIEPQMMRLNTRAVMKANGVYAEIAGRLPLTRQAVDVRRATAAEVDDLYTRLVGVLAMGLEGLAHYTPDSANSAEEMAAADLVRTTDLHSRVVAFAGASLAQGPVHADDRHTIAQLVGAYRYQLNQQAFRFTDDEQARYRRLIVSAQWRTAIDAEDQLVDRGAVLVPLDDWRAAEQSINDELVGLFRDHIRYADSLVSNTAHQTLDRAFLAGAAGIVISIVALASALTLANRLVRRLRWLRSRSLRLANETLPAIIQRLHEGERVDVEAETMVLDGGADEIGQVAEAFTAAQRTAMATAAAEARTRDGFNRVFVDIAQRSQVLVRRQLDVLDIAEAKQDDPEHLELLFQLDHLATRARRNAENLLILGGAQPGRRWRQPVSLEQLVRSAASETQDFARVSAIRLPSIFVLGAAVTDVIHLLSELIDNAALFSPPQTAVAVHGSLVGRGIVVEIEDRGLGMEVEQREGLNQLLRNPPDFHEITLTGQRSLGLFVVGKLAQRHGITVRLQESAYGGVNVIVLIPARVLVQDGSGHEGDQTDREVVGRHGELNGLPRSVADSITRMSGGAMQPSRSPFDVSARLAPADDSAGEGAGEPISSQHLATGLRSRVPLPRRQRLTHLAPELLVDYDDSPDAVGVRTRPADEVRNSMASFQRQTRRARECAPPSNP